MKERKTKVIQVTITPSEEALLYKYIAKKQGKVRPNISGYIREHFIEPLLNKAQENVSSQKVDTVIESKPKSDTELTDPEEKTTTKDLFEDVLLNLDTLDKKSDRESFSIGGESINI